MSSRQFRYTLLVVLSLLTARVNAGVVEDWNKAFLQAVRKEAPPPCLVSRNLPIFHLSIHRAVIGTAKSGMDAQDQERAAFHAAEAAFKMLFPSQPQFVEALRAKHVAIVATDALTIVRAPWMKISDEAVERTFKERENDGSSTTIHYVPSDKPGQWRRTPPNFRPPEFPHWGKVKPFVLDDATKFRAPPPPDLASEDFARDVKEVKELGGKLSTKRTDEQTLIARFWSDFSYTTSPAGHWNDIARELTTKRGMNVAETARIFAVLNVTLADTCIAVWDTKYHYNFWRPVTAIQREDKAWVPLLATPPHPEYVSGHSGISGAAAAILEHFFGTKDISFEADSDTVKDVKRRFTSFKTCAEEIAESRIYGGIHYTTAGKEGLKMGRKIAEAVLAKFGE